MLPSWTWGDGPGAEGEGRASAPPGPASSRRAKQSSRARSAPNQLRSCAHGALAALQAVICEPCAEWAHHPDAKEHFAAHMSRIRWAQWSPMIHPAGGDLPTDRIARKQEQIESLLVVAAHLIDMLDRAEGALRVVEFCGGSGYVALPLAAMFPQHEFVVIDMKSESIARAHKRIRGSGLLNVRVIEDDIRHFREPFALGIALHACGGASDLVLQQCVDRGAAFLLCPCCIGKILAHRSQPLSQRFSGTLSLLQFRHLARAGDTNHEDSATRPEEEEDELRRGCKLGIEEDRCHFARERGYSVLVTKMQAWASPKRDIIAGWLPTAPR